MKILLLGEYSNLLSNLRKGLEHSENEVFHIHGGDNKKRIAGASFNIGSKHSVKIVRLFIKFFKYLFAFRFYFNNDVVVIINQTYFILGYLDVFTIFLLRLFNKKIILMACGDDVPFIEYGKAGKMKWWVHQPYNNCVGLDKDYFQRHRDIFIHNYLAKRVDVIVPTTYTYKLCWENTIYANKVGDVWNPIITVELPVQTNKICDNKITILHGRNRPCEKGSPIIGKALEMLQNKWGDYIQINIFDLVPLNEYIKLMNDADIVVDQCLGYDYGSMNCLLSIAMGKTVLVSSSAESIEYNNIADGEFFYVVNPSSELIFNKLDILISDWEKKKITPEKCQEFITSRHDLKKQTLHFLKKYVD